METKKTYQSPQLTVAVFKSEHGYVGSVMGLGLVMDEGDKDIEERQTTGDVWGSGSDWNR